jgi:hypothetical protein
VTDGVARSTLVRATTACALVLVALVPLVADRRLARADLTRDGRGFSQWHRTADGVRFRWMMRRAVLYVPAAAREAVIPLRSTNGAATVRVVVAGRQEAQVVVGQERWQEVRISVPQGGRWACVPVALEVRGEVPAGTSRDDGNERHLQVALPQW